MVMFAICLFMHTSVLSAFGQEASTPLSVAGSITKPGNYSLTNDIRCSGTCFYVSGPGIHLDLNGHTLIFGTMGGTPGAVYGIENDTCTHHGHSHSASPCDRGRSGVDIEISNGRIVQSRQAPPFSHALFFASPGNTGKIYIHNLDITIQQTGTRAFTADWQTGAIRFEHNTVHDNVISINHPGQKDLDARSQFQGQAVWIGGVTKTAGPDRIGFNTIIGSPQGGIRDTSDAAEIYNNDIGQNATYSNDFCIDVPGNGQMVHDNYCHPVNGRGIHVNGENSNIYNNTIVVTEAVVDREYGKNGQPGCQLEGAYGIQVEDDNVAAVGNTTITGNRATLNTGACGGGAFRITGWPPSAHAVIRGNTWTVNKTPGADQYGGYIYFISGSDLSNVLFGGDTITTNDDACAGTDWDGVANARIGLTGCVAPYAFDAESGNEDQEGFAVGTSTFTLTHAPNTRLKCGENATARGTINGTPVHCIVKTSPSDKAIPSD